MSKLGWKDTRLGMLSTLYVTLLLIFFLNVVNIVLRYSKLCNNCYCVRWDCNVIYRYQLKLTISHTEGEINMYGVEILVREHDNILRIAEVMRMASLAVLEGREVNTEDFEDMVEFVRNYADKHHHGKEEDILFVYMKNELGKVGENLIQHGMLVEHDLGRLHIKQLYEAAQEYKKSQSSMAKLDIITNAVCYSDLIKRHIGKENEVVFTYGEKNLSEESRNKVDVMTKEMEENAENEGIQKKYISLLEHLERIYL